MGFKKGINRSAWYETTPDLHALTRRKSAEEFRRVMNGSYDPVTRTITTSTGCGVSSEESSASGWSIIEAAQKEAIADFRSGYIPLDTFSNYAAKFRKEEEPMSCCTDASSNDRVFYRGFIVEPVTDDVIVDVYLVEKDVESAKMVLAMELEKALPGSKVSDYDFVVQYISELRPKAD